MAQLDRLPPELIQKVVLYGSVSSVVSLSAVNRSLRAAGYNVTVIKIIGRSNQVTKFMEDKIQSLCNNRPEDDVQIWARYNTALSKPARTEYLTPNLWLQGPNVTFEQFVPQLIVLGC